jgi:RNA polymerase sigma-70 factor, ECF subfamily
MGWETPFLGDNTISDQFIRQHYAGLHALLQRRIGDPGVAADMLNEAVATAITHTQQGRIAQPERLAGYVFRVAMNLYRNYAREFDNRSELRAGPKDLQEIPSNGASVDALEPRVMREVRSIVLSLPTARDREIVTRFYLDEEDKDDICQSLGLTPLHFDKVIFRARQRLKALLEERGFHKTDFFVVLLACLGFG